jgi:hypothetical protein
MQRNDSGDNEGSCKVCPIHVIFNPLPQKFFYFNLISGEMKHRNTSMPCLRQRDELVAVPTNRSGHFSFSMLRQARKDCAFFSAKLRCFADFQVSF